MYLSFLQLLTTLALWQPEAAAGGGGGGAGGGGLPYKLVGGVALLITLVVLGLVARHKLGPYHFREVEPGILYRSGVMRPYNLRSVIESEGIRTVINLQPEAINELPWHEVEDRVCRENGATLVDMPLGPEEPPRPEYVQRFLELINDPARRPVLVHCQHGVIRTGMLVAVYQLEKGGERSLKKLLQHRSDEVQQFAAGAK